MRVHIEIDSGSRDSSSIYSGRTDNYSFLCVFASLRSNVFLILKNPLPMLICALAYFYVIAMIVIACLVGGHWASGLFTLAFAGLLPGWLGLSLLRRKRLQSQRMHEEP